MKLKKDLVDELIRITQMYYKTGKTDILIELDKTEYKLKQEKKGWITYDKAENKLKQKNRWIIYDLISLIEDLSKFAQNSGIGTYEDIYKALEVFGVIVE